MGSSSKRVTVGYKYHLGIHIAICHAGVDKLTQIKVDDRIAWTGDSRNGTITVNSPDLFGGSGREGGITGKIDLEAGDPTQGQNAYLQTHLGADIPAFRGVFCAVLKQVYLGLNPYLKPWSFRVQRIHKTAAGAVQWYNDKAAINYVDMNPAHIIRECLTDTTWGMGYLASDVDDVAFRAAADALHTEGMGISLLWDKQITIEAFITEIIRHISAALYVDPLTGKFTLKLIRGDYTLSELNTLDETNVTRVSDYSRVDLGDAINSISVIYWDRATEEKGSISVDNLGLIQQTGNVVSTTIQYPGFTSATIASIAADRDLKIFTSPLLRATIEANREASSLNIGDVFKFEWPDYHSGYVLMRIHQIAFGDGKQNRVKITATEDIFAQPTIPKVLVDLGHKVEPVSLPTPSLYRYFEEAPYYEILRSVGQSILNLEVTEGNGGGYVVAAAARAEGGISSTLWTNSGGGYEVADEIEFCPIGLLSAPLDKVTKAAILIDHDDLEEVRIGSFAVITNSANTYIREIIRIDSIEIGGSGNWGITFGRGVLDTVPRTFAANSSVLFVQDYLESDGIEYALAEAVYAKMLTNAPLGVLTLANAPEDLVGVLLRSAAPYPPGNFKVNNLYFPETINPGTDTVLTWAHRDRTQQTGDILLDFEDGSVGPETGVTYHTQYLQGFQAAGVSNIVLKNSYGITGTSDTFTESEEKILVNTSINVRNDIYTEKPFVGVNRVALLSSQLHISLSSSRVIDSGALHAYHSQQTTLYRVGYGYNYGNFYRG